ncbi:hypothetical protein JTE90_006913 [Oedothorax gibbosus]|uniref:Uncharacterized protein n=1 Tax=Oedothorax gibbosus TaxID=931172 RepID=A0AAV6VMY6_9ARAC|nr:hypothetical protein JTE90_006913 [Oedothorax gibbosus]
MSSPSEKECFLVISHCSNYQSTIPRKELDLRTKAIFASRNRQTNGPFNADENKTGGGGKDHLPPLGRNGPVALTTVPGGGPEKGPLRARRGRISKHTLSGIWTLSLVWHLLIRRDEDKRVGFGELFALEEGPCPFVSRSGERRKTKGRLKTTRDLRTRGTVVQDDADFVEMFSVDTNQMRTAKRRHLWTKKTFDRRYL